MYNINDLIAFNDYMGGKAKTYYQLLKLARDNQYIYDAFLKIREDKENGK